MCDVMRSDGTLAASIIWDNGTLSVHVTGTLRSHAATSALYAAERGFKLLAKRAGNAISGSTLLAAFKTNHFNNECVPVPATRVAYGTGTPRNGRGAYARGT